MKNIYLDFKTILSLVFKYTVFIIATYIAVDAWVISRANTVVDPVKSELSAVHKEGMDHINKRFDRIEYLIIKGKDQ
jgi:hypothetical protein